MTPRILVAGIGNIFLGDDAFGCEVVNRLAGRGLPEGVRIVDFGNRGLDLAYALLDGYEAVVLVDATPRGGPVGTLYVLELALDESPGAADPALIEAHSLDPARVLRLAAAMGGRAGRVLLVGCEPGPFDESDDMAAEMGAAVREAVGEAIPLIESLVSRLLRGEEIGSGGDDTHFAKEVGTC